MSTTRREFIHAGGALVVYFALPGSGLTQYISPNPGQNEGMHGITAIDTWIRVESGGQIVISAGKVEFGQGITTALAQIAAEELDIDLRRLRMAEVDTARSPDESYTFSAVSVQQSGSRVRKAAAQARLILLDLASEELGISASRLSVDDGSIRHQGKSTDVDYWGLLEGRTFDAAVPDDVKGKPLEHYQVVGYPVRRLDIPAKVFAQASYLSDIRMPGMVHARIVRPTGPKLKLDSLETETAAGMPGVLKVIQDGSFLALVAEREFQAARAVAVLEKSCKWQDGKPLPDPASLSGWLKAAPAETSLVTERLAESQEPVLETLSAEYNRPYLAHASIAASAAIALWDGQKMTVWSHGQGMYPLRAAIANALGLEENQLRCIHAESGGVYGHNGADDAACDAAAIALHLPGRPVKLQWTRADEFSGEPYGSAMTVDTEAGLNKHGRIVNWKQDVWSGSHSTRPGGAAGAGHFLYAKQKRNPHPAPPLRSLPQPSGGADRNAIPLYDIPVLKVNKHLIPEMPLRVSALRSLGAYINIFAIESFMDELAVAAGVDPFEFRLRHLTDQRARLVLEKLRDISSWAQKPKSNTGRGWGIGFAQYKNLSAYLAVLIKLTIEEKSGRIQLDQAQAVVDAGLVVNPDGVRAQIEGGIVQSASWTLKEKVRYNRTEILSRDWVSYPILGFSEVPDVEVEILERQDLPWLGVAEAAQGPTAAAIANAVYHATELRLRNVPLVL